VEAFHSTLEEAAAADVILNICDASSPEYEDHLRVTEEVLKDLGAEGIPTLQVMNKCDLIFEHPNIAGNSISLMNGGKDFWARNPSASVTTISRNTPRHSPIPNWTAMPTTYTMQATETTIPSRTT